MSGTARLGIPFLSAGQAQKEFTHNEALQLLDMVVAPAVEEGPRSDPPASPAAGACYIIGASATGEWVGQDHGLACFSTGGWRILQPIEGMSALVKDTGLVATYRSGSWEIGAVRAASVQIGGLQVLGTRAATISDAVGGTTVDAEARAALGQILAALRHHGLIEA